MYYSELPDCIRYKIIRWPEKVLHRIIEKHNNRAWIPVDAIIYTDNDWKALLIEKTQEEIVEEIKDWIQENTHYLREKYNLSIDDVAYMLNTIPFIHYVKDFDMLDGFFKLSDVYPECFEQPKPPKTYSLKWKKVELPDPDECKRVDILQVLDRLWVDYKRIWHDTYALYENWRWTDWWRANTTKNIVTDFSSKWRAQWNPLNFVIEYLWIDVKDALLRFKEELWL